MNVNKEQKRPRLSPGAGDTPSNVKRPKPNKLQAQLNRALHGAVINKDLPKIRRLVNEGASPNAYITGRTMLAFAIRLESFDLVHELVIQGANIHICINNGYSPLILVSLV